MVLALVDRHVRIKVMWSEQHFVILMLKLYHPCLALTFMITWTMSVTGRTWNCILILIPLYQDLGQRWQRDHAKCTPYGAQAVSESESFVKIFTGSHNTWDCAHAVANSCKGNKRGGITQKSLGHLTRKCMLYITSFMRQLSLAKLFPMVQKTKWRLLL